MLGYAHLDKLCINGICNQMTILQILSFPGFKIKWSSAFKVGYFHEGYLRTKISSGSHSFVWCLFAPLK